MFFFQYMCKKLQIKFQMGFIIKTFVKYEKSKVADLFCPPSVHTCCAFDNFALQHTVFAYSKCWKLPIWNSSRQQNLKVNTWIATSKLGVAK